MSVLGIDLSASLKRPSFHALIDGGKTLSQMGTFKANEELLEYVECHRPALVAIGAPLCLPMGLDCLEESHACAPVPDTKGRMAERELARMHIGCFFTTKRSIIKTLIYRGLELRQTLEQSGYQVIEVYPYATKVLLFGDKVPPKSSPGAVTFLKERLLPLINGMEPYLDSLNNDRCDALLAAYTACLHLNGGTDLLGTPEEGHIVVPKLH